MKRRIFLKTLFGGVALAALSRLAQADDTVFPVQKSDAAWKAQLTPDQYDVLRHEETERPFSSPLNDEHRAGTFACAGCGQALFPSRFKFDSGTGWPSFYDALPGALDKKTDYRIGLPRTEYHCARCGGHHGHIFDDGPQPTGLRYCSNGVALTFTPA